MLLFLATAWATPCWFGHDDLPPALAELVDPTVHGIAPLTGDRCWPPVLQGEVARDHVIVEFAEGVDAEQAAWVADRAQDALEIQVDHLGWRLPPGMPEHPLMIYLSAQSEGGGVTTTKDCGGVEMPVIAFTQDALIDPDWGAETIAHEVHHAIQHAYGDPQLWFWEATATWMQRQVVPEGTAWTYWLPAWADRPWMGMAASGQQSPTVLGHMFGMVVWPMYLEELAGDAQLVQDLWLASEDLGADATQSELLAAVGQGMEEHHAPFLAALAARSWRQADLMLPPVSTAVDTLPAEGDAPQDALPEPYGALFVRIDAGAIDSDRVRVTANGDPSVPWTVVVVSETASGARWDRLGENGGVASGLVDVPTELQAMWIAMSPRSEQPRGGHAVSWRVEAYVPPVETASDKPCGCASSAVGAWWMLAIPWLRRRRR